MDIETLRTALQQADLLALGLSLLGGFIFSFNPAVFAAVPVVLAYVTKAKTPRRAMFLAGAFVAGMLLTHGLLGAAAALGGEWVQRVSGREWGLLLGPVLIFLGLIWTGWLKLRIPWFSMRGKEIASAWGAFLLGMPFTVAVCPVCAPALLVALTASAAIGSAPFGFVLLLAYALGRSVPILLGAWGVGWLQSLTVLTRHQRVLEVIAGCTLILTGLYFINSYFFIIPY